MRKQVERRSLKVFLLTQAERVKQHALDMASVAGGSHQYLTGATRKEEVARRMAERDGITEGMVCRVAAVKPVWGLALRPGGRMPLRSARLLRPYVP